MCEIIKFEANGRRGYVFSDDLHPTISFSLDFEDEITKIDQILLKVNHHEIDVTSLTHYRYEFDDLKFEAIYEFILEVKYGKNIVSSSLTYETTLKEFDAKFISDPSYNFKEKRVSPKVMSFLKEIKLDKKVLSSRIHITTFGVFNLYLNNEKVNEEYLMPGFTSYKNNLQYLTYDITKYLKSDNSLRIDVAGGWAVGSFVMSRKNRIIEDKQALALKLVIKFEDGSTQIIESDESFLVTTSTPYQYADLYDGEGYDSTKEYNGYHKASFYKTKYDPKIYSYRGAPIVKKSELIPTLLSESDDELIFDFKQNFAGVISLGIRKATLGQRVVVKHAEILNEDGSLNTSFLRSAKCEINYVCKEGKQTYSPTFTYMGFRYVSIKGIKKEDVEIKAYLLSSDNQEISTFECDNPLINRLNQNIRYSSLSNFMEIPTDCPQRDERMGWTGDIAVFAQTALFNFNLDSFLNKWLVDVRSEQTKGGGFPNVIPSNGYGFPETMPKMAIEFWGDAILFVPYQMYLATGNKQILIDNYESMKKYVKACLFWAKFFSVGKHRYIWHTPASFHFGDWVAPDVNKMQDWQKRSIYTATCSLKNNASLLAKIAEELGYLVDMNYYEVLANKVTKSFNEVLTDGHGKCKKEFQTAYTLPIYFNMFSEENKRNALENLVRLIKENDYCIGTGFPGTPYILFALADNGYQDVAYKMLLNEKCPSWLYEVKVGATTIWERWDGLDENGKCSIKDDGTEGMISYNHYASGAVGAFLYTRLAGLSPLKPGYESFRVQPILCDQIKCVSVSTISSYGKIEVSYKINKKFVLDVKVPLRSSCEVILPNNEVIKVKEGKHHFELESW